MRNFVNWWWDTLADDTQQGILEVIRIIALLLLSIIFFLLLSYPMIFYLGIIVAFVVLSGIAICYFRKQYQKYLDNQEKEMENE